MSAARCVQAGAVDRHFAGRSGPAAERTLRDHLGGCATCRTRYARHLQLGRLDPRALPFDLRLRLGLGLGRRPVAARLTGWSTALGALALGLWLVVPRAAPEGDGWRARGAATAALPLLLTLDQQGTEVMGFRTSGPEAPAPVTDRIRRDDEMAFAYRNGGGWQRLMVFARDEAGAVFWFSPQWSDPSTDPVGVELLTAAGQHELPTAVAHDLAPGKLVLCALVSRTALSVRQVEQALGALGGRSPADLFGGHEPSADRHDDRAVQCRSLEVLP